MSASRAKRRRLNKDKVELVESADSIDSSERLSDHHKASTSNAPQEKVIDLVDPEQEVIDLVEPEQEVIDVDEQKSCDEPWSGGESKDDSDSVLATCRLRHGLNDDCLCEVFKFLAVYDLIQLCELDIYFQNLIIKWVIGKKLINFTKMDPCWTTNKIFQIFGKAMRKIKIAEENTLGCFERFLTFVTQYSAVGGLTEMELRFSDPTASQAIMDQSMPHFSNLRKLVLNDNYQRVWYHEFLAGIAANAPNLTYLTLEGVNVSGEWLTNGGMQNLKELRLHASKRRSMNIQTNELAQFLHSKPKLEIFSHIGPNDITDVTESLIEGCPKLQAFGDFHLNNPYNRSVTNITTQMMHRYAFVRQFSGVTTIGMTSYTQCGSDIYYPLVKLAVQNRVEELKIYMDLNNSVVLPENSQMRYSQRDFGHYTRLRSIELQIRSESSDQCELNAEFICDFLARQTNIEAFTVMCEPALKGIHKVLDMAPHLKELGISHTKMKYLPVEMLKIVRSIRKRRKALIAEGIADPEPFQLVVNVKQWREVQVYADVNTILTATIDGNDENQSFNLIGV